MAADLCVCLLDPKLLRLLSPAAIEERTSIWASLSGHSELTVTLAWCLEASILSRYRPVMSWLSPAATWPVSP